MAGLTTSGAYLLSGHDGPPVLERFTCVEDGGRWSYEGVRQDPATGAPLGRLELQRDGGTVRLHAEAGGWVLRGAAAGGAVVWRRGSDEREAAQAFAAGLAAVIAEGDSAAEPLSLIPLDVGVERCAGKQSALSRADRKICATPAYVAAIAERAAWNKQHAAAPMIRIEPVGKQGR